MCARALKFQAQVSIKALVLLPHTYARSARTYEPRGEFSLSLYLSLLSSPTLAHRKFLFLCAGSLALHLPSSFPRRLPTRIASTYLSLSGSLSFSLPFAAAAAADCDLSSRSVRKGEDITLALGPATCARGHSFNK